MHTYACKLHLVKLYRCNTGPVQGQHVAIGENSQCVLDDGVWEIVPEAVEGVLHSYVSQTHSPQVPMHAVHPCLQNLVHV